MISPTGSMLLFFILERFGSNMEKAIYRKKIYAKEKMEREKMSQENIDLPPPPPPLVGKRALSHFRWVNTFLFFLWPFFDCV